MFVTYIQTLARFPDTLLGSDEKDYFYDVDADEYFFDRDPVLFSRVLAYYRTGHVHWPRSECVIAFNEELDYFGIRAGEVVSDCCLVSTVCVELKCTLHVVGNWSAIFVPQFSEEHKSMPHNGLRGLIEHMFQMIVWLRLVARFLE